MTKKEQTINGVDVSGCIHIDEWKHCNCCNDLIKTVYPNATKCHTENDLRCETYPNCNFKQLARKIQECEQKDKELLSNEKIINKLMKEVDELRQKCEELKNIVSYWEQIDKIQEDKLDRYRKALENLEEFCLNF